MHLVHFIQRYGPEYCAERWGFSINTVKQWLYKGTKPMLENAKKIIEIESGLITMDDIYTNCPFRRYDEKIPKGFKR